MHKISKAIIECFESKKAVLICGNGGSMTQADHMAEELLGKFEKDRVGLPAISLSNPSTLSAIANDYDYRQVFARQVEAYKDIAELLITISTSGTSSNIVEAQGRALLNDIEVIPLPTNKELGTPTYRTQETHLKLIHRICREVENYYLK